MQAQLRYGVSYFLRHPVRALTAAVSDPLEVWAVMRDREFERREEENNLPPDLYEAEEDWESRLHELIAKPWPCEAVSEFQALWFEVIAEVQNRGIYVGPESYGCYNDGDAGFMRAIWCLTRHLRPRNVVETGVAHGFTSRFILEALERNEFGHLWSIDRQPLDPELCKQIGVAVGGRFPHRWTYIKGSSRRKLPGLLAHLGPIDLFIHDSLHTEHNVRFEVDHAWQALRPSGAIVVDDIDCNWGFHRFTQVHPEHQSMVCNAEPLRLDLRRFNQKGLFGLILKNPREVGRRPLAPARAA